MLAFAALPLGAAQAADADTETRLRDALRNAITQSRGLEDERAGLQAKLAQSEKEKDMLRQQVEALTKQVGEAAKSPAPAQTAQFDRVVAELNRRLAAQNKTIGNLGTNLEKWKASYNEAAGVARAKEAERAQLAAKADGLAKQATACEAKNGDLFKIGNEILDRYAAMGFGDVLAAREPFIGFKRVELQNMVQDYQNKLRDQKVVP
jgi:predicted RNase H-like nuclease (RuvC/YqgF family)